MQSSVKRRDLLKALGIAPAVQLSAAVSAGPQNRVAAGSQQGRPNILLILADDMGYSDLGCYGSEIKTPNIDRLAQSGIRFTHFYNAARCCPSRASLMTGLYPHQAGVGHMLANWRTPGYTDGLSSHAVTIPEVLRPAGYRAMMAGKWHLGWKDDGSPRARGFERFYGMRGFVDSYFTVVRSTDVYLDDALLMAPTTHPINHLHPEQPWYTTDVFTDYALYFMDEALRHNMPFFQYVAYNAPHFPLHAFKSDIQKYRGKYRRGWEVARESRFRRLAEMRMIQRNWELSPQDSPVWNSLTEEQKDAADFRMAIYAAIVDRLDQNVGRLTRFLEQRNQLENTLILFLSDNGGSSETGLFGLKADTNRPSNYDEWRDAGGWTSSYGQGWANVSNTPFRMYKSYDHEGGISAPLILHWPNRIRAGGELRRQVCHIMDILPTLAEITGASYPEQMHGQAILPYEGKSLVPVLDDKPAARGPLFWEHEGNRAVRDGKWKLVARFRQPWALYDIERDRTELNNMIGRHPEVARRLEEMYSRWARRCHVLAYDEVNPKLRK